MSESRHEMRWWLQQIGRHPLLTSAEEIHLATMVQAWQQHPAPVPRAIERRGLRARDRMINANLRLVVNVAKKYTATARHYCDLLDLCQAGNLGLCRGVERFDPARGYKFSTYGYWWIRQGITRHLEEHSRTIRHPSSFSQRLSSIDRATRELICGLKRPPTVEELAEALGMKPSDLTLVLGRGASCVSLDAHMTGDSDHDQLGAIIADPDSLTAEEQLEALHHQDRLDAMANALAAMPQRQRHLLQRRWGLTGDPPCTIKALAEELGIGTARIGTELSLAQAALRLAMSAQAPEPNSARTKQPPRPPLRCPSDWRNGGRFEFIQLCIGD